MKTISFLPRIYLLALALGTASVTAAFAQTTTNTAPTTPAASTASGTHTTPPDNGPHTAPTDTGKHHQDSVLTADEMAQLDKDRAAALAANPDLKTEEDNLKQQHEALKAQGDNASDDAKAALKAQKKDHEQKMDIAMLKIDPSLAPILAKLKAAHKERKHDADAAPATTPAAGA